MSTDTPTGDLIQRLRALSRHEHDDFSIGDEAADEIERLRATPQAPLSEFRRMQIIGDEFPLALVEPIVIQKIDAVCRAIEREHGIGEEK